ncbi:MAG TPA: hypothetical protein VFZ68_09445 [Acidimicrobiales bacterium]
MAGISRDDVAHRAGEALYTAVGLGVLGVQHLQVQRRELARAVGDARARLGERLVALDETFEAVDTTIDGRVDEALESLEPPLAEPARACVRQTLTAVRSARDVALATAKAALGASDTADRT